MTKTSKGEYTMKVKDILELLWDDQEITLALQVPKSEHAYIREYFPNDKPSEFFDYLNPADNRINLEKYKDNQVSSITTFSQHESTNGQLCIFILRND